MDVATLKTRLQSGEPLILIDVRDVEEIADEPYFVTPPKNYLNIPVLPILFASKEELQGKIFGMLQLPLDTPIITLCHSGGRSERACAQLRKHGWNTESLDGGVLAWGQPI
ncbi:MAG: rhodanese-like domain-containing protein [Candidatus Moraniibacteriota bacterium]|nr:MAG: rhodanese-like domain-containing protein [Candidatus Moranbacteria bacterium]